MISDDELLLYYYRDGLDPADRARIGAALSEQPELAQRLHRLVARLDAVASSPDVPVPAHTQRRWLMALEREAQGDATRATPTGPRFFTHFRWQAAAAALAAIALTLTILVAIKTPPNQVAKDAAPGAPLAADIDVASAYERGLRLHLASTEQRLAGLDSANPDERARLIETIIAQNRLYALAAERAGEPQLARVLRAFTPVLENVAQDGTESAASSIAQLSFELRVMQARLRTDADAPSNTPSTAL